MASIQDQYCPCFDVFSTCTHWDRRAEEDNAAAMQFVPLSASIVLPAPTLKSELVTISVTFLHIKDIVVMAEQGNSEFNAILEWD